MNDYILFKNLDDKYLTLPEILKKEEVSEDASEDVSNDAADTSAENALKQIPARLSTMLPTRFSRASTSVCSKNRVWTLSF